MSGSHKYTWEKDKLTFFTPILEIKTKKLLLNLKGHQSSGAWAPELWCPKILLVVLLTHIRWQSSSYFLVHNNITKSQQSNTYNTWFLAHLHKKIWSTLYPLSYILYPYSWVKCLYIISDGVTGTMAAGHWFEATKDCPRWADQEQEQGWLDWIWQMDDEVLPWQVAVAKVETHTERWQ